MAQTYTATIIPGNHDVDYRIDDQGQITGMIVKSVVVYGNGEEDQELRIRKEFDIWPLLTDNQKITAQTQYAFLVELFDINFLGE